METTKKVFKVLLKVTIGIVAVLYGIPCVAAFTASIIGLMGLGVMAPTIIIPFIVIMGMAVWLVFKFLKWIYKKIDGEPAKDK